MREDIPEALREAQFPSTSRRLPRSKGLWFLLLTVLGIMLAAALSWFLSQNFKGAAVAPSANVSSTPAAVASPTPTVTTSPVAVNTVAPASPSPVAIPSPNASNPSSMLGHLAYAEAPASQLQAISADPNIQLRSVAANKYDEMVAAARQDGVDLATISGFRSIQDQNHLFFDVKAQRRQGPTERAQVSAPPGYSEHHTGYAVDIGDRSRPDANLNERFDQTPAFKWLKENAATYSFELSFPKGNTQGVMYEPWHWRFVGDSDSLRTFYAARQSRPAARP
jgi:zinc D-Ala-D-Ala carboxypeptidase